MKTKVLSFMMALAVTGSALGQEARDATSDPGKQQALEEFLTYINPYAYSYKIESTWTVKTPKQTDLDVQNSIADHLRARFSQESNSQILPGWIQNEAIVFERRVVCDSSKQVLARDTKQKAVSSSSEASSTSARFKESSQISQSAGIVTETANLKAQQSLTENSAFAGRETFNLNGYTVVDITEKVYQSVCLKSHLEFRGTLLADRILRSDKTAQYVKIYLANRALNTILSEFKKTIAHYNVVLNYVLNTPGLTETALEQMKLQPGLQNSGSAGLVHYLKSNLIAMISIPANFQEISRLFSEAGLTSMARQASRHQKESELHLFSIATSLQVYGGMPKGAKENMVVPRLSILISASLEDGTPVNGSGQEVTLFHEQELRKIFATLAIDFKFSGEKMNPSFITPSQLNHQYEHCVQTMQTLAIPVYKKYTDETTPEFSAYSSLHGPSVVPQIKICTYGSKFEAEKWKLESQIRDMYKNSRGQLKCIVVREKEVSAGPARDAEYDKVTGTIYCLKK